MPVQLDQILLGLESGLDVSIYADVKYPWYIMKFAKQCLLYNIKPEQILNEKLDYREALDLFMTLEPNEV